MQFSPPNFSAQEFFTPNNIFPIQRTTASRGFTNGNRHAVTVSQTSDQIDLAGNDDYDPQSPPENARKRSSTDFTLRPKKRNRSLTCNNPACHNRTFADEPNLNRHLREVHGQAQYHCPIKACERHMRGFKRRDNCINHQKRSHGNVNSLNRSRDDNVMLSRDSSIHVTEDGEGGSSPESEGRGAKEKTAAEESEPVMQKMGVLRALMKKKRRVQAEIDRATAELQHALQQDVNREE